MQPGIKVDGALAIGCKSIAYLLGGFGRPNVINIDDEVKVRCPHTNDVELFTFVHATHCGKSGAARWQHPACMTDKTTVA
jgi:hypothetical protein